MRSSDTEIGGPLGDVVIVGVALPGSVSFGLRPEQGDGSHIPLASGIIRDSARFFGRRLDDSQ